MAIATSTMLLMGAAGMAAAGAIGGGIDAKNKASFEAADQRQQGAREKQIAEDQEEDFRRQQSRVAAASRAAGGQSGVDQSTGSPLLAMSDFEAETELNALRIRTGGETQSQRLNEQAVLTAAAGKSAKNRGFIRAGSSLLSGGASTFT
tara:strand:+ start:1183 stop:1629 length:447 start_codon:yes stop_codon:yes gene_type:complete